jgi:hypothetical protein
MVKTTLTINTTPRLKALYNDKLSRNYKPN